MTKLSIPAGMKLPRTLNDVDAEFMTGILRARGVIDENNHVASTEDEGVGMTAGYFSAIKRVRCHYATPTDAASDFVVKTWPDLENAPKEQIADMFMKDIAAYSMPTEGFYPRPKVYLADFDTGTDSWALLMDDVNAFGEQKLHESEMNFEEVMHMVPKLVEIAIAWEGCHAGDRAAELDTLNVVHWASDANLAAFRQIMPGGARLFDAVSNMPDSTLVAGKPWNTEIGEGVSELFTRKLEAFYSAISPENGGTCTLVHGDLRGDNLFFCPQTADYPDAWLTIDFQLMTRGPIPSDLAYLMNSGSVLPEVSTPENREKIMRTFFDSFMAETKLYKHYTWDQFCHEYSVMATVLLVYYVGFGANIWQTGITEGSAARVEVGLAGAREEDLPPEQQRQRMWWRKAVVNFRTTFQDFGIYDHLKSLPDNQGEMGPWFELPEHLR